MKFKHTKGVTANVEGIMNLGECKVIELEHKDYSGFMGQVSGVTVEECIANARLMAAAAELLEAAVLVLDDQSKEEMGKLREAIDKALHG